jgi:membrane carboxypeptidase/penicillin-binding protein
VGYTPDLVVGVWVGIDDGRPVSLTGAQAALPVWGPIMQAAVRRAPPRPFTPPPGIVFADVDRATGEAVGAGCAGRNVVREAFREGTAPAPADCSSPVSTTVAAVWSWIEKLVR